MEWAGDILRANREKFIAQHVVKLSCAIDVLDTNIWQGFQKWSDILGRRLCLRLLNVKKSSLNQTCLPLHMAESLLGNPALSLPHAYAFVHISTAVQCQRWGSELNMSLASLCGFSCSWGTRLTMPVSSACSQNLALLLTAPKLLDIWSRCVQSVVPTSCPGAVSAPTSVWFTFHM